MAGYDRRDLIGHWVRRNQREQQMCTHACCRGYRVHPANYPVIPPKPLLRRASDDDLAAHYDRVSRGSSQQDRYAEAQILYEFERRDAANLRRRDRERARVQLREARAANRAAVRMEREAEYERIKADAEAATVGYLVTPLGRARGIADEEILRGRESVFVRYATREAKDYFAANPRPTAAYFRGQNTRVRYSDYSSRTGRSRSGIKVA